MEPGKSSLVVSQQNSADRNCIFTHVIEGYLQDHLAEKIQCKWPPQRDMRLVRQFKPRD